MNFITGEPVFYTAEIEVGEYSPTELEKFKTLFTLREKERFRRLAVNALQIFVCVAVVTVIALKISEWVFGQENPIVLIPFIVGALLTFAYFLRRRCPACRHEIEHSIGPYCPCCGQRTLNPRGMDPSCSSCGAILKWTSWQSSHPREFRVRACSICGVPLHDTGV